MGCHMTTIRSSCKRDWRFDFLKGISCIFVVFLHSRFPGAAGDIIIYVCRFPVPLFFMISGYFCYSKERAWIKKRAFNMLKMLFLAELFYGIWNYIRTFLPIGTNVTDYLKVSSVLSHPVRTLLSGTVFNGTLWYLYAAFWTYCILYVFPQKNKAKSWRYLLIPILLCLQIFGRFYWQNHHDIDSDIYLFRNALLFGLPLTLCGSLFAELEGFIKEHVNWRKALLICAFGGLLIIAEYFISGQYMDFHLSTIFTSAGLFLLAMTYPFEETRPLKFISYIGRRLSMWIYVSASFFDSVIYLIAIKLGLQFDPLFLWLNPILTCVSSALFALIASEIKNRIREFSENPIVNI